MISSDNGSLRFLGLPQVEAAAADFVILPLPYEGTVSYGSGTSRGPEAVLRASAQVERWDDELAFELDSLRFHTADAVAADTDETPEPYLERVQERASQLKSANGVLIGVGGEHSVTPPLVRAAAGTNDLSELTVVQIDAHTDLRHEYEGSIHSHACAMRRLAEAGATIVGIGIRSTSRKEVEFAQATPDIHHYRAQDLMTDPGCFAELLERLRALTGPVYLTVDVDGLTPSLCPGTGTPEPGGLEWYPTLQLLRGLLNESEARLIGMDFVETVPMASTQVNEFTTARLMAKTIGYASV